jgi:hypothetical protein
VKQELPHQLPHSSEEELLGVTHQQVADRGGQLLQDEPDLYHRILARMAPFQANNDHAVGLVYILHAAVKQLVQQEDEIDRLRAQQGVQ